ncbi:uncharacterized protein LOC110664693 [Hevea brasiliensis]|uniref:uncharacterized protein LOC110664693 n=1 Tax=Hevea brasiliensis TaxID=3981 RepID=UPI0025D434D3|nr:uncharacterized protein LOC110664693 [Hevea brasiliensis]
MGYMDIANKCMDDGYSEVCNIGYFKPRESWDFQTLVCNDTEVRKMWEEGNEFGFLKIFIEFTDDKGESSNTITNYLERNNNEFYGLHYGSSSRKVINHGSGVIVEPNCQMQIEMPLNNALMFNESSNDTDDEDFQSIINSEEENSIDESLVNEYETKDEEFLIALKNRKQFKETLVSDGINAESIDDVLGSSHPNSTKNVNPAYDKCVETENFNEYEEFDDKGFKTPYTSDENDLGDSSKKKRKGQIVYNPSCDHTSLEFVIRMLFEN